MKKFLNLYIAKMPNNASIGLLNCNFRNKEINEISNEKVKREKYWIWKLFEIATIDCIGISADNLNFRKNKNGKIYTDDFYFSFSHSYDFLIVAISSNSVGVDIEKIKEVDSKFVKKVLNKEEFVQYQSSLDEKLYFFKKWTQKEAIFKCCGRKQCFVPIQIDTINFSKNLESAVMNNYVYSFASIAKINEVKFVVLGD